MTETRRGSIVPVLAGVLVVALAAAPALAQVGAPIIGVVRDSTGSLPGLLGGHGRHEFRVWSAKLLATYPAPWDVLITPRVRHQSGQPFGRPLSTSLNCGNNIRILAEPIGTRRMDNVTLLDVRVEKGVRFGAPGRVAALVDVFNALNANPEQNTSWSSGSFLRPLNIVAPRIARVGAKVEW